MFLKCIIQNIIITKENTHTKKGFGPREKLVLLGRQEISTSTYAHTQLATII